jgi:hypothetical protein
VIKIEFIKDKIPFTQVANGVLTDKRLSAKAKGLYAYLYSKPDGWDFAIDRIALEMADGRKSINEGLKELEALGFLTRKRQSDGRVLYLVHFPPIEPNAQNGQEGEPNAQKAIVPKSHMTKMGTVSNKDSIIIKNISNKDIAETSSADIVSVLDSFVLINPACKNYYGNKTQRKACQDLINTYSTIRVKTVIENTLPKTNKIVYFPSITTPVQLRDKWVALEDAVMKYQIRKVEKENKNKVHMI